ncbi:MAG: hypothetical protein COA64_06260 [Henriciella sp.]|nr:MAG: hypothetical protein COA64_06260 [Henriciella sp.]
MRLVYAILFLLALIGAVFGLAVITQPDPVELWTLLEARWRLAILAKPMPQTWQTMSGAVSRDWRSSSRMRAQTGLGSHMA